jgi:excisionase family DNA binding protein
MGPREIARASGLGLRTVYDLIDGGELPAFRTGKWIRVTRRAYEAWLDRLGKNAAA